ncbi:ABC transporter ATP-binding protein [Mumia sp. Pv 4-285]|uniref:ABC transporter ATP-binding protein n=1 Tax=Mumia qirimensis TaxID=3234852 RepID=UPI00351D5F6B
MTEPIISVQNVSVRFHRSRRHRSVRDLIFKGQSGVRAGEFFGLRHISFDVQPGEAIGVVGRNGQGKSTLLKTIAGVLIPDEGRVVVNGGVAPLIEITGGFVGDLTVRDNIYLAAGLHGMSKKEIAASFDEIVEFAEIEDFVDTPYKHLSSGMKVRVAFSVVSRLDEPILLVDEVLAVGDRAFREKCFERIDEMLSNGRTLFMVSHSEANLTRFCSRGLYLREGQLILDGPIQDVVDQYFSDSGDEAALRRRHERRMRRMRKLGLLSDDDEEDDEEDGLRTVV